MTQHEEQDNMIFTRSGAVLGFIAYIIVALIVASLFL